MSSVISSITGGSDTDRGVDAAAHQTYQGIQAARKYGKQAGEQVAPYQKIGTEAADLYRDIVLGGDMSKFKTSPGYQFRLGEGVNALEQGAAARGNTLSGAQQKALMGYGQNLASEEYGQQLGRIGGLMNQGFSASQAAGNYLMGTGSNIAGQYGQLGRTQAGLYNAQAGRESSFMNKLVGGGAYIAGSSDRRLKENIKPTGEKTKDGIDIVEFNYNEKSGKDTSKRYRGVIAQDVEKVIPEAVKEIDGYKHVNYDMLGIKMEEI